jgi:hypothetical protein
MMLELASCDIVMRSSLAESSYLAGKQAHATRYWALHVESCRSTHSPHATRCRHRSLRGQVKIGVTVKRIYPTVSDNFASCFMFTNLRLRVHFVHKSAR